MKTYSVNIKIEFEENDDKYFENLHIYKQNGEFKSLIFRYNEIDDYKDFDFLTFTGQADIFDYEYNNVGILQYENGDLKCVKTIIGCLHILDFGNGDILIGGTLDCNDSGGGGGDNQNSGNPLSGNPSGVPGTNSNNTGGNTNTESNSGNSYGPSPQGGGGSISSIVPNPPTKAEQFITNLGDNYSSPFYGMTATSQNLILNCVSTLTSNSTSYTKTKLYLKSLINNNAVFYWFNSYTQEIQSSIFNYLIANNFSSSSTVFTNQCITQMINNPILNIDVTTSSKSPALIDLSSIDDLSPEGKKFNGVFSKNYRMFLNSKHYF